MTRSVEILSIAAGRVDAIIDGAPYEFVKTDGAYNLCIGSCYIAVSRIDWTPAGKVCRFAVSNPLELLSRCIFPQA